MTNKITSEEYSNKISELIGKTVTNCLKGQHFDWDDCEKFLNLSLDYLVTETYLSSIYEKGESIGELTVIHSLCDIEDNCYEDEAFIECSGLPKRQTMNAQNRETTDEIRIRNQNRRGFPSAP